ncbi:MAG: XRE family transcriptional regulator [Planctomycetes bacterium]|nr:XRE family transcriptional regulator [Planctomycetota bacterium]
MRATRKGTPTRKKTASRRAGNALEIIDGITGRDPKLRRMIIEATINARVAEMLYEARTKAGLTQKELADLVGTKQPVIARLEDAEYQGHSLTMLQRIATALDRHLEIRLTPVKGNLRPARRAVHT